MALKKTQTTLQCKYDMNILVVDDEALAKQRLIQQINEIGGYRVVAEAANGVDALVLYEKHRPEIVLLDIRMPTMDGIEAARHLSEADEVPAIIFTTAYDEHMQEAFETDAIDYLLKPIRKQRLEKSLKKASKLNQAQISSIRQIAADKNVRSHICVRERGDLILIPVTEIIYFRADSKYVAIRGLEGEMLIEESLKALEAEFKDVFVRVHRSTLIAPDCLSGLEKDKDGKQYLIFKNIDDRIEVSRRHLPEVRKLLKNLI